MAEGLPPGSVEAALAISGAALPLREAAQLDLLPADRRPTRDQVERLPRGRGRPAGSANKRTAAWRDYLLGRYAHPLETLAQIQSQPVDKLAAELGCKPVEALAVIARAASELAPYLEGKMPVAVDMTVRPGGMLVIEGLNATRDEIGAMIEGEFLTVGDGGEETADFRGFPGDDRGASE